MGKIVLLLVWSLLFSQFKMRKFAKTEDTFSVCEEGSKLYSEPVLSSLSQKPLGLQGLSNFSTSK